MMTLPAVYMGIGTQVYLCNDTVGPADKLLDAFPFRGFHQDQITCDSRHRDLLGDANGFLKIVSFAEGVFCAFIRNAELRHHAPVALSPLSHRRCWAG